MTGRSLRVLFAASEAVPYFKTGGLADVARALPDALVQRGHDVRLVLPYYRAMRARRWKLRVVGTGAVPWPGGSGGYRLLEHARGGAPALLVDAPRFFDVTDPYAASPARPMEEGIRFAFFSRVVAEITRQLGADVVHLNDWQTGMVPAYGLVDGLDPLTVFVVHNLAYQGNMPPALIDACGLPGWLHRTENGFEFHGYVSFMKAGISLSDRVVTVSPTYAAEIRTPAYGAGLDGLLRSRRHDLVGILNGIDTRVWDPARDSSLSCRFDAGSLELKERNRRELLHELGLDARAPLFVMVGRLVHQKGIDLVAQALPALMRRRLRLAVLGDGDPRYEEALSRAVARYPRKLASYFRFDEGLARRMYAGADFFLMPSLFEPCGLGQMIAQRYGTPPVARRTGGLADTIEDGVTGFLFEDATRTALIEAVDRARDIWRKAAFTEMRHRCMNLDSSWTRSAEHYERLYLAGVDPLGRAPGSVRRTGTTA